MAGLLNNLGNLLVVFPGRHYEQTFSVASGSPKLPDDSFLLSIERAVNILALILNYQYPPIIQLADEIRVKPIFGSLQTEGSVPARQVSNPVFDFNVKPGVIIGEIEISVIKISP
jgi:hypothetical protein